MKQKKISSGTNRITWNLNNDIAGSWGKNKDGVLDLPVKLISIKILQYPAAQGSQLLFRTGDITQTVEGVKAIGVSLETGNPFHILKVGEEDKLAFLLKNYLPLKNLFDAELNLYTLTGEKKTFAEKFCLAPGETVHWKPEWPEDTPRGVWRCHLVLRDSSGREQVVSRPSFAYLEVAGPRFRDNPEFELGINMRQQHSSSKDRETEAELAGTIGARMARSGYTWESIERQEGMFDFSKQDDLLALNAKYGVKMMNLIAYTPKWAANPKVVANAKDWNDWNKSPPDPKKLERYVEQLAQHYKGRISLYEFWNEPELEFWRGTADEFIECQKIVYRALKKADPDAKLITAGFSFVEGLRGKQGFQKKVLQEAQDAFDYHGFHMHGDFFHFKHVFETQLLPLRKVLHNDKPLYLDETGFYVSGGNYMQQMENVIRKIIFSRINGVRGYLWYDLRDDGFTLSNPEHNYGIITRDWYPKEALAAFNTLSRLTGDATYAGKLLCNKNTTAAYFRKGNDQIITIWRNGSSALGEVLAIDTDAKDAQLIDFAGNVSALFINDSAEANGGKIHLNVPDRPSFILLKEGQKSPIVSQGMIKFIASPTNVTPNKPFTLNFLVCNPQAQTQSFELNWQLPKGITAKPDHLKLTLKGKDHKMIAFQITAKDLPTGQFELKLNCKPDKGKMVTATVPINLAAQVMPEVFPKEPQFKLEKRDNVFSLMEHNPLTRHRVWSGPNDQSARVFLCTAENALKVRVEVTDNIHIPSREAAKSFMEDGVQLALAIPEQDGHWEFGFCQLKNGNPDTFCWLKPENAAKPVLDLKLEKQAQTIIYNISIPFNEIKLDEKTLHKGIRFNLLINDNDGQGRDGWIQIAPGIGEAKDPGSYPFIIKQ